MKRSPLDELRWRIQQWEQEKATNRCGFAAQADEALAVLRNRLLGWFDWNKTAPPKEAP